MDSWNTEQLASDDKRYVWHPFTSMGEWCAPDHEPIVLVGGEGRWCAIAADANTSTEIRRFGRTMHGHNHPRINAAIREQLERVAHTSFLGTTNPPAIKLAREIVNLFPEEKFGRVFYSDDGSTGMEAALRIVSQYWKLKGSKRRIFISFRNAYHGDTAGAASLGAASDVRKWDRGISFPSPTCCKRWRVIEDPGFGRGRRRRDRTDHPGSGRDAGLAGRDTPATS